MDVLNGMKTVAAALALLSAAVTASRWIAGSHNSKRWERAKTNFDAAERVSEADLPAALAEDLRRAAVSDLHVYAVNETRRSRRWWSRRVAEKPELAVRAANMYRGIAWLGISMALVVLLAVLLVRSHEVNEPIAQTLPQAAPFLVLGVVGLLAIGSALFNFLRIVADVMRGWWPELRAWSRGSCNFGTGGALLMKWALHDARPRDDAPRQLPADDGARPSLPHHK